MGPTIQFWTRDNAITLTFLKTLPISSYLTRASGGYIMTIRPMAMGIDVVPQDRLLRKSANTG